MNHGNYFTDHNKPFVVSNAKQLTAPKPETKEPEPHPLQREFIDVLKSLGVYEKFKGELRSTLPVFAKGMELVTYCNLFKPATWVSDSGYDIQESWRNYLKQYHEAEAMDGLICDIGYLSRHAKQEKPTPEITQQEKFKQFLRDKGALEKFEYWLMNAQFSMLETHSNLAQAWTNLFGEDLEEWVTHAFDWSKSGSHVFWAEINADWLAICKDENIN